MAPRTKSVDELCAIMAPWPQSWSYDDHDLKPGRRLIAAFTPFVRHLHAAGLSPSSIKRHMDGLWQLGGDLIKVSAMSDPPDPIPPLSSVVDEEGGPLLYGTQCERDQREFDATCKKLHRFLAADPPVTSPARRGTHPRRTSTLVRRLDELIEDATCDAYDEDEQISGFLGCFDDHIRLPFTTDVLGVSVTVARFEQNGDCAVVRHPWMR